MNIGKLLTQGYDILKSKNIESYIVDTQLILGKVLNKEKLFIITNRDLEVSDEEQKEFFKLINLRGGRMPVKYILGQCEFMGLLFSVREGVLIPRPDTEILVETVIKEIEDSSFKTICDVCCGSGVIGISVASLIKEASVLCSDISEIACEVTYENILKNDLDKRVGVVKSDLMKFAVEGSKKFDVIVSNPPYIKDEDIPELMEDVKNFEPYLALSGGEDGLYFYRRIIDESKYTLEPGGLLAFEIGYDQKEAVSNMMIQNGFESVKTIKDLQGYNRVIVGRNK